MPKLSTATAIKCLNGPRAHLGWASLVETHGTDLWRVIYSIVRDQHEAEDLYQEFWLALPKAAIRYQEVNGDVERAARSWLMRIAYTTTIDSIRRRRSRPLIHRINDANKSDEIVATSLSGQPVQEEQVVDRQEKIELAHQAIAALPENYRRPLLLYVVGGLSYDELAADLNCSVNNARVRVHRGIQRLREIAGYSQSHDNDRHLVGIIVPATLLVPATPAMPAALSLSAPVGSKALFYTKKLSWYHSPTVGFSAAVIIGVGSTLAIMNHPENQPPVKPPISLGLTTRTPITNTNAEMLLDDFERSEINMHVSGQHNSPPEQSFVVAPLGRKSGQTYGLQWGHDHQEWVDAGYNKGFRIEIPELRLTKDATISLSLLTKAMPESITHFGIRFMDANGEIFGYRQPLTILNEQWQHYTFLLEEQRISYWSDNAQGNQQVDYPIRLFGFVVGLNMEIQSPGALFLDDVKLQTAGRQ